MNKSTLPVGIKSLMGWKNKGTLTFDNPIQRAGSQWSLLQKSLLIHSVIMNYPIPPCYFLKAKNDAGDTIYDCLDSKQRLSSIFEFVEGGYTLHAATPPCRVDGFDFDLAGMSFEELSDDVKDEIIGCRLSIFCLEDCTDEEVEEIFTRLNNATPLSAVQKVRSIMSSGLSKWAKEICKMDFFQHSIGLTVAQLRREADLEVLLQSMLLLDARHEGYDDWKGISTAEVTKYCHHIRGKYNEDKRRMVYEIVDFLGVAFKERHKFLKKSNIPMIMVLAKLALENGVEPQKFKVFLDAFASSACADYEANTGSGNVKRAKTEGRLKALGADFEAYFGFENVNILGVNLGGKPDGSENSEAIEGLPSSEAVGSDDELSCEAETQVGETDSLAEVDNGEAGEDTSEYGDVEAGADEAESELEEPEPIEDAGSDVACGVDITEEADNSEVGEEAVADGRED